MLKIAVLAITLGCSPACADVTLLDASARGNIGPDGSVSSFIFAGFVTSPERDWFEFSIPNLTGPLAVATLELFQPQFGHLGGSLVYSVYALSGQPASFSDITSTTLYGSIAADLSTDGATLLISLDAAARAAIQSEQGGNFFIGGIDSGENGNSPAGDFAGEPGRSILSLTTVPEPAPVAGVLLILSLVRISRKRI